LLHHRDLGTLANVLRLWALVLASNIAGTWAVGYVLGNTSIFEPRIVEAFVDLADERSSMVFQLHLSALFLRAG
jgi:formate-nitrite transporter family protein